MDQNLGVSEHLIGDINAVVVGKVAHNEQAVVLQVSGVNEQIGILGQEKLIVPVHNDLVMMPHCDEFFVVLEDRILAEKLFPGIDLNVVGIYRDPGGARGEAGVFGHVPLHGGAGVVAALGGDHGKEDSRIHASLLCQLAIGIDRLNIPEVFDAAEGVVGHAQLFSLIDEGSSLHHVQTGRDAFCGGFPEEAARISKTVDDAGLVMVAEIQAVPGESVQTDLPFGEVFFEGDQGKFAGGPFVSVFSIEVHVLKLEDHVELCPFIVCVLPGLFHSDIRGFSHRQQVIMRENFLIHFLQIIVHIWPVEGTSAITVKSVDHRCVGKPLRLGNQADHVHAEAVDPLFAPARHHIKNFPSHAGIVPVEIRLFSGKLVQVIHVCLFIIFPGGTGEKGSPVIGRTSVFSLAPEIKIPFAVVAGTAAFYEPRVLIGSVVDYQVHDDPDAARVRFFQHAVKIRHGAEFVHYGLIVADIISVVIVGRAIYGGEPDDIDSQLFQIIQFLRDPIQVADSVTIAVHKTARVDLVYNTFFPPGFIHKLFLSD